MLIRCFLYLCKGLTVVSNVSEVIQNCCSVFVTKGMEEEGKLLLQDCRSGGDVRGCSEGILLQIISCHYRGQVCSYRPIIPRAPASMTRYPRVSNAMQSFILLQVWASVSQQPDQCKEGFWVQVLLERTSGPEKDWRLSLVAAERFHNTSHLHQLEPPPALWVSSAVTKHLCSVCGS